MVSSIVIGALAFPTQARAHTAFAAINYEQDQLHLGGQTEVAWIGDDWNDVISSVLVIPGWRLTLYQHINFGGAALELTDNVYDLRNYPGPGPDGTWNDVASSYRYGPITYSSYTFVVNGTGDWNPDWIQPWHPFMVGIQNTYGLAPRRVFWTSNSVCQVSACSGYSGIASGALEFANQVNASNMPYSAQFNIVGFSHGANVGHVASQWHLQHYRPADHFVQIAMPHNWDIRQAVPVRPYGRHCSVFSSTDTVVLWGSGAGQTSQYSYNVLMANYYYNEAFQASQAGNWADAAYYHGISMMYEAVANDFFWSARWDPLAHNFHAGAFAHTDMHYDWMFTNLPSWCKTN